MADYDMQGLPLSIGVPFLVETEQCPAVDDEGHRCGSRIHGPEQHHGYSEWSDEGQWYHTVKYW